MICSPEVAATLAVNCRVEPTVEAVMDLKLLMAAVEKVVVGEPP
jgi:hypothetical protein